jgi:hypothetical protein
VFAKLEHAQFWAWHAMESHFDRGLGMANAVIERFEDMVSYADPPLTF